MIGSLPLSPTFKPEVTEYTGETSNESDTITATPYKKGAAVKITVGETPVENGGSAAWEEGENSVKVAVSYGTTTREYTVTVTKSAAAAASESDDNDV